MRYPFVPAPPGGPPAPTRDDGSGRRVRRTFLVVNAAPLVVGVALSCSTTLSGAHVYGRLTFGLVWGVLQLGVFLAAVGWYERRSTRLCDSAGQPLKSDVSPVEPTSASSAREFGR